MSQVDRVILGSRNRAESSPGRGQSHIGAPELEGGLLLLGVGLTNLKLHVVPALLRLGVLRVGVVVLDRLLYDVLHLPLQLRGGE